MAIPDQPIVYVLCREQGEYSDYSMTVLQVCVSEDEANKLADEFNSYVVRLEESIKLSNLNWSVTDEDEEKFLTSFHLSNPQPALMSYWEYNKIDFWDVPSISVHAVKAQ